jgi:hypothetical protein
MKFVRLLSRIFILLSASAAFVGATDIYGRSAQINPIFLNPLENAERLHQPSAPEIGYFSQFMGYTLFFIMCTLAARTLFRMRLNPAPRGEGHPVLLDLHQKREQN